MPRIPGSSPSPARDRSALARALIGSLALAGSLARPGAASGEEAADAPPNTSPAEPAPRTPGPPQTGASEDAASPKSPDSTTAPPPAPTTAPPASEEPPAEAKKPDVPAWETAPWEYRGGFAVGIVMGLGLGASNGFPADAAKIGRSDFYTESGLGLAGMGGLWIGGALSDWLTFGLGGGYSNILQADTKNPAPYGFFSVDVYPLYPLGDAWRDLGLMTQVGLTFARTDDAETAERLVDGNGASYVFAGAVWEGLQLWKIKFGPFLGAHYIFSQTMRRPAAMLGFRTTLYTLP